MSIIHVIYTTDEVKDICKKEYCKEIGRSPYSNVTMWTHATNDAYFFYLTIEYDTQLHIINKIDIERLLTKNTKARLSFGGSFWENRLQCSVLWGEKSITVSIQKQPEIK